MKLKTTKRKAVQKSEITRLRQEGMIPAVVYHRGKNAHPIAISKAEYEALTRQVKPGRLATTKITLVDEEGKERQSVLKEIQYEPTSYAVLHLDFEELDKGVPVSVKVPVECTGIVDSVGIKLGGSLRQSLRQIKVRALPNEIPEVFQIDIRSLEINQALRVSDLKISDKVKTMVSPKEVVVSIAKR